MCKIYWKIVKLLGLGLLSMALIGCAGGKSFDYQPTAGEMKPGPGALTGESGELSIYDSQKGGLFPKEGGQEAESASAASAQAGESPTGSAAEDKDFQEFQEYLEWKNTAKGSEDLKEFQQWKEWKSYQEWKKKQKQP